MKMSNKSTCLLVFGSVLVLSVSLVLASPIQQRGSKVALAGRGNQLSSTSHSSKKSRRQDAAMKNAELEMIERENRYVVHETKQDMEDPGGTLERTGIDLNKEMAEYLKEEIQDENTGIDYIYFS